MSENQFIPDSDNPFEGYNDSIKENFGKGETHEYQKLCYQLFKEGDGAKWLEMTRKDINQQFADLTSRNADLHMAANQGARTLVAFIEMMIVQFEEFIKAEKAQPQQ